MLISFSMFRGVIMAESAFMIAIWPEQAPKIAEDPADGHEEVFFESSPAGTMVDGSPRAASTYTYTHVKVLQKKSYRRHLEE